MSVGFVFVFFTFLICSLDTEHKPSKLHPWRFRSGAAGAQWEICMWCCRWCDSCRRERREWAGALLPRVIQEDKGAFGWGTSLKWKGKSWWCLGKEQYSWREWEVQFVCQNSKQAPVTLVLLCFQKNYYIIRVIVSLAALTLLPVSLAYDAMSLLCSAPPSHLSTGHLHSPCASSGGRKGTFSQLGGERSWLISCLYVFVAYKL